MRGSYIPLQAPILLKADVFLFNEAAGVAVLVVPLRHFAAYNSPTANSLNEYLPALFVIDCRVFVEPFNVMLTLPRGVPVLSATCPLIPAGATVGPTSTHTLKPDIPKCQYL